MRAAPSGTGEDASSGAYAGLTADAKAALDDAKTKAVSAFKKDDDPTCHKAIAEGMTEAGITLK